MDYQGNYFPEEHDENESKVYRTIKGIFKWSMYAVSFVIYAIIFYMMIVNSDSYILKKNYMGELNEFDAVEVQDIELYRINTRIFMDELGTVQVYNIDYAHEFDVIEIGVRYNSKKLTDGNQGDCLNYILYDSDGNRFPIEKHVIDGGGRYGFARICFTDVDINLDDNDLRYEGKGSNPKGTGKTYHLEIRRKSDNYLIYTFDIYDNSTTFNKVDYHD